MAKSDILVVEDSMLWRAATKDVLEKAGFGVRVATSAEQALDVIQEKMPDLILTDIAVPGIDGIELCRRLRADARTHSIPVLAVTGYGDRSYPDRVIGAGANQVLIKPCSPDVLISEVRRLLALKV